MSDVAMENSQVKLLVAAHKPYWMPSDSLYLPVQVGAAGKDGIEGFQRDDEGDNISSKNPRYCELTALYWAWKNLDVDYIGLAHYRRHFKGSGDRDVMTLEEAKAALAKAPVVLPKKRNYVIETIESHYAHTFDIEHINLVRAALSDIAPEYLEPFEAHMGETSSHILNMMLMRKDLLDEYCAWLFPILDWVDGQLDYSNMSPFEARAVGRLSELLLDVWLAKCGYPYTEVPLVGLEKTNWVKKGTSFLAAKFAGKKYKASF